VEVATWGVPVPWKGPERPTTRARNSRSALAKKDEVGRFLAEEIRLGRLIPVDSGDAMRLATAPIAAIPKADGVSTRVIVDHSQLRGGRKTGINGFLDPAWAEPAPMARVGDVIARLAEMRARHGPLRGQVTDIDAAYRQVPTAPEHWPLLAVEWEGTTLLDARLQMVA
jgi:hypothetical protein